MKSADRVPTLNTMYGTSPYFRRILLGYVSLNTKKTGRHGILFQAHVHRGAEGLTQAVRIEFLYVSVPFHGIRNYRLGQRLHGRNIFLPKVIASRGQITASRSTATKMVNDAMFPHGGPRNHFTSVLGGKRGAFLSDDD